MRAAAAPAVPRLLLVLGMSTRSLVPRPLSDAQLRQLAWLRHVADLLDNAFVVPGTSYRIGWDPILGVMPGLGDLVTPAFGVLVLLQANRLGVPRLVQVRMVANVAIDFFGGLVPIAGDLFDASWKANVANMRLLERHAYEIRRPTAGDWLFAAALLVLLAACAIIPLLLFAWAWHLVGRVF